MKKFRFLSIILVLCLMMCGCSNARTYYAYTIYPIGYLLNRIGGNKISTISIQDSVTVQNSSINSDYEKTLSDSMFLFYINGLEPYMDIYRDQVEKTKVEMVDLSYMNAIYQYKRYSISYEKGQAKYSEEDYYSGDCFKYVDGYKYDMYIWMDPIGMLSLAKDVYTTLSSNYVEEAAFFKANYEALEEELVELDAQFQNLATKLKNNQKILSFVTMTPSFGTWQKAFGFQVYPVCLSKYGSLPTDEQLNIIKAKIIEDGVKYIVYEPNMTDEMIELYDSLRKELGLKTITLSSISSLTSTQQSEKQNYLSLMKANLVVLEGLVTSLVGE